MSIILMLAIFVFTALDPLSHVHLLFGQHCFSVAFILLINSSQQFVLLDRKRQAFLAFYGKVSSLPF